MDQGEDIKQLTEVWYERLKQEGYQDIEDHSHPDKPLLAWHNFKWKNLNPNKKADIEAYYEQARSLLHTYLFENEIHRIIWELHCEGFSKRRIEVKISTLDKPYKREAIGLIINMIAKELK